MVIIISRKGQKVERVVKSEFTNEKEMQKFINEHPESILTGIKDGVFLTFREFPTKAGPIDVLAIDSEGSIYIVETKLISNSDRRDVIAQALDYAAALAHEYSIVDDFIDTLENELANENKYAGHSIRSLLKTLMPQDTAINGQAEDLVTALVEQIGTNLEQGNFKIIVIMDRVEQRLKDVIYFINQKSKFTLYAIDMEYYKYKFNNPLDVDANGSNDLSIMVQIYYGVEVKKDADLTPKMNEDRFFEMAKEAKLTKEQLDGLRKIFDYSIQNGGQVHWPGKSLAVTFPKIIDVTLFTINPRGNLQLKYGKLQPADKARFLNEFSKVPRIAEILDEKKGYPMYMGPMWLLSADLFVKAIEELQNSSGN